MATQPRASQSQRAEKRDAPGDFAGLAQRIHDLGLEAVVSVAGARVEETAQQWLAKTNLDPNDPASPMRVMEAFALSSFLTLLSSSLLGVSPLERFVRQHRANADDLSRGALDAGEHRIPPHPAEGAPDAGQARRRGSRDRQNPVAVRQ